MVVVVGIIAFVVIMIVVVIAVIVVAPGYGQSCSYEPHQWKRKSLDPTFSPTSNCICNNIEG